IIREWAKIPGIPRSAGAAARCWSHKDGFGVFVFGYLSTTKTVRIICNAIYIFVNLSIVWDRVMANSPSLRGEEAGGRVATCRRLDSKDVTPPPGVAPPSQGEGILRSLTGCGRCAILYV